jgi:hypothetical protein
VRELASVVQRSAEYAVSSSAATPPAPTMLTTQLVGII